MFIDEKIREYIEQEKEGWQEVRKTWEEVKALSRKQKELNNYLSTYTNDSIHQQMKEDFDKVLDNIESLVNTFNFKTGMEIAIFNAILIHNGYLSITNRYSYNEEIQDICYFQYDKLLSCALKIFSGTGCCRHTATFTKKILDKFNIENSVACVDSSKIDYDINKIRLFLHNIHKKSSSNINHAFNYISENGYNYFLDLTYRQFEMYRAFNQFAYSVDDYNFILPLYSYDYSRWNDELIDYRKVPKLTDGQVDYLIYKANYTIDVCKTNRDLLMQFYLQNLGNYRSITENYNKVYEKEKSLNLIKK